MQSQKSLVNHVEKLKWVRNVLYFFPNSEVLINYRLQLSQLAKALVYLHEEFQPGPIVHLDVRCVCNSRQSYCVYSDTEKDNILVDDQKDAVLSDFGLTRINNTIFKSIPLYRAETHAGRLRNCY